MRCKKKRSAQNAPKIYVYITIKIKGNGPVTATAVAARLISLHISMSAKMSQVTHSLSFDQLYDALCRKWAFEIGKVRRNAIAFAMPFEICTNHLFCWTTVMVMVVWIWLTECVRMAAIQQLTTLLIVVHRCLSIELQLMFYLSWLSTQLTRINDDRLYGKINCAHHAAIHSYARGHSIPFNCIQDRMNTDYTVLPHEFELFFLRK